MATIGKCNVELLSIRRGSLLAPHLLKRFNLIIHLTFTLFHLCTALCADIVGLIKVWKREIRKQNKKTSVVF